MEFIEDDFVRMRFNPRVVPQGKRIIDHYPDLQRIFRRDAVFFLETQFGTGGAERVIRYICFMYDMHTPLKRIVNYSSRKTTAMKLAGFSIKDNELIEPSLDKDELDSTGIEVTFTPHKDLFYNKMDMTNRLIVLFARSFKDYNYVRLQAMEETYFRNIENMMNGKNNASQDKGAMEVVEKTEKVISALYEEVYNGKPEKDLIKETMMVMEEDSLGIQPEDIARRLLDGEYIRPY